MTPTVAVMTDAIARGAGKTAGMVITASHNPQEWCGLKCLLAEGGEHGSAACAPPIELAEGIIARFREGPVMCAPWHGVGRVEGDESASEEHVDRLLAAMSAEGLCELPSAVGHGSSVALDSVNASGVGGGRLCLESLGCDEIMHVGADESGVFPHPPEPVAENLALPGGLCDAVREAGFDVGFAQDPDADRLAVIDGSGRFIGEEYTLALVAMALLEARARGGDSGDAVVVTNLSTSRMVDDLAARYGARVLRTAVGEAHVVEAMKREAAAGTRVVCGGEGNGGVIWPRVAYVRDSLSAMALVLWLMSPACGRERRRSVSELVDSLPRYAMEKRKITLARREDASPTLERIAAAYAGHRVDRRDGVRVDFTNGPLAGKAWLHVRASNTEPIMRLIAEAPTPAEAGRVLNDAAAMP